MLRISLILLAGLALCALAHGNAIDDKMYKKLSSPVPCTRWLHSKGQIGCSTSSGGSYGVFWPLESKSELDGFKNSKKSSGHLIPVLNGELFTPEAVSILEHVSQVKGLVIISNSHPLEPYSETSSFPQANTTTAGEDGQYAWNIPNHDTIHYEYKFPIWSVIGGDASTILSHARQNRDRSTRYGAQLKQFMYGYKDAATCLRYKFCEPVGGHSVWGILPKPSTIPWPASQQFVMTLSRLDAISLFAGEAVGADADMSGLIANLAALTTLAGVNNLEGTDSPAGTSVVDPSRFKYPILWAFFDAEHWGYAGSTRFLNDWTNFKCITGKCTTEGYVKDFENLRLSRVRSIFEMRQVGAPQTDKSHALYVHQHEHNWSSSTIQTVLASASGLNASVNHASTSTPGLPPSSAFTFLNAARDGQLSSLSSNIVVITDHKEHYQNPFYGSRYDTHSNVDLQLITDAATLLARSLYASAMDVSPQEALFIQVNSSIVKEWWRCTTVDANCALAHRYVHDHLSNNGEGVVPPSHYHGPFFEYAFSVLGKFTHDYMTYVSRNRSLDSSLGICEDDSDCHGTAKCARGVCIDSSYVQFHDSYSLGIEPKVKGGWSIIDPTLENWVEPYWDAPAFDVIYVKNTSREALFFVAALFLTILSFGILIWFKSFIKGKFEAI